MKKKKLLRPNDLHTHLRSPAQLGWKCFRALVKLNCWGYCYVVIEPNAFLDAKDAAHQIETVDDLVLYRKMVTGILDSEGIPCKPLFLIKLTPKTTRSMIRDSADAGAIGCKLYPEGVTTGSSHGGVSDFYSKQLYDCLEYLQERDLVLQEHSETPHTFCLHRELLYHPVLTRHAQDLPNLRIFVEHVSDRRTLTLVRKLREHYGPRIYATITGHHPILTLDDVLGQVDSHCWPCLKTPRDRDAIAVASAKAPAWIISVTDSAFWKYGKKHLQSCGCAGVFNPAEIAIPSRADMFERMSVPDASLERFWARNGLAAYKLEQAETDTIDLEYRPWQVPLRLDLGGSKATPFYAGKGLPLRIVGSTLAN